MVVLLEGSPFSREKRWGSVRVLGHLPDKCPFPLITQFRRQASSRKSPKHFPFMDDGGHWAHCSLQSSRNFLYPSLDLCLETILSRRSADYSFDFMLGLRCLWSSLYLGRQSIDEHSYWASRERRKWRWRRGWRWRRSSVQGWRWFPPLNLERNFSAITQWRKTFWWLMTHAPFSSSDKCISTFMYVIYISNI